MTADEARKLVLDICKKHNAKMVVKSKSMVSEEIHLSPALEQAGIEAVETDLAEYIIQLAGEPPSHIIVPAIHKNRHQIAELFGKVAGHPVESDTPSLTAFAHPFPRYSSPLWVWNALYPTFEDLEALLTLLPRSATGQKLTSYVSVINKTRNTDEKDGAKEFHLLILDNGRSRLLENDEFRQALHCIRCGACFNVCPVYRQIGGHAYASVYGGPIGSVITPLLLNDLDFWGKLAFASSLCAA